VSLLPDAKNSIKRIALVEVAAPAAYTMNPGQMPGGAALYMFGAIGGAILGGIETNRFNSATQKFNDAVTPLHPDINLTLLSQIEARLRQKGYEVTVVSQPPKTPDGKSYDLKKINGTFDAVLVTLLNGGYGVVSDSISPQLSVSVSLTEQENNKILFSDIYTYSSLKLGDSVQIVPNSKFILANETMLYTNIQIAVDGMKEGAEKIAERIAVDL
jgi:hypothetical protein